MKLETKAVMDSDMSETALDDMRHRIGADRISDLKVFCSDLIAIDARRLQAVHGFELVVVIEDFLASRAAWGATWNGRTIWTHGVD